MIFETIAIIAGIVLLFTSLVFIRTERQQCAVKYYARKLKGRRSFYYPDCDSIQLPRLQAEYDQAYLAASRSSDEKVYEVNLHQLTCTCADWKKRRATYPIADIRRVCKHLYEKLYHQGLEAELPIVLRLALQHGRKEWCFQRICTEQGDFILAFNPQSVWVKVFACIKQLPIIATYRLDEDRWAYGRQPPHSCLLQAQIDRFFFTEPG